MGENERKRMAVALIKFRKSYAELVLASKALPDLDVSEGYPFYLLDFEKIEPAVSQWCNLHASNLLHSLPFEVNLSEEEAK